MLKIYFRIVYSSKESQLQLLGLEIIKKIEVLQAAIQTSSQKHEDVDCDYLSLAPFSKGDRETFKSGGHEDLFFQF